MEEGKRYRQSRQLTFKIIGLIFVAVISMVVMAVLISNMQTRLYQDSYMTEMQEYFTEIPGYLEEAEEETARNTENFDQTYQSLAQSVAYMAGHDAGFEVTYATMKEYQELFQVDNVSVVTKEGVIIAQASLDSRTNYSSSRFNQLRTVFSDGKPSEAMEINLPDEDWHMRYYAARIDDDTMVVIQKDPAELEELIEENGSLASVFGDWSVGENGYFCVISSKDYTIDYHPDENLNGKDGLSFGMDASDLEDGNFDWLMLNGEMKFCGFTKIGDRYYIAIVPRSDMTSSRNIFMGVILIVFFVIMFVVIMHGIFVMREEERRGIDEENIGKIGPFRYSKGIVRRAAMIMAVGFLIIVVASFYMQTLFALSSQSVSNRQEVQDIVTEAKDIDDRVTNMASQYEERYLPICKVVGYILDENPDLINQVDLSEIADMMYLQGIYVYDANGSLEATNVSYTNYEIVDDPDTSYYEFLKLLQGGADYVVQNDYSDGTYWQNLGVTLHNENGLEEGLVSVSIRPVLLENLMESANIETILDGIEMGSSEFAFVVDKENDTFVYYPPNRVYEGESVLDHGMTENELKDGYIDYITIDGTRYYSASAETDDYYIYLAGTEGEMMAERLPLTAATSLVALLCLIVVFLIEVHEPKERKFAETAGEEDMGDRVVETEMPNGRWVITESAASRWLGGTVPWNERSAWQKTVTIIRWMLALLVAVVCVAVVFQDSIFSSNSIFAYILSGNWERGLNIFAITACLMFICVAITIVTIVQRTLLTVSEILSAHGETICRMLHSFLKYATIIGMTFYCLYLIGIDGTTLLASAGILSLAITFGAQSLVSDILSGLFIIFEGEFRVGDIIMVGDWRGTVLEIGIRTTKVQDGSQNVKVIRNSDINNVINMTKKESFLFCDFSIEYEESLERVETVLEKELPLVAERLPAIKDGPYYRGVTELGESAVVIRITMKCLETDRMQLERDFNREIKLIFDRNGINIPYNQIVIHEAPTQQESSED